VIQVRSAESLQFYLDVLFDLHGRRWATKNAPGSFERDPRLKSFYRSFAPKAMKNGWLSIVVLEAAGRAVALQYGYRYKGTYMQLQEGFDPSHISGLGTALRKSAIDLLIGESVREYDFLGGYTEHKRRWQAIERAGCHFLIANRRPLSHLLFISGIWPTGRFLKHAG
jgi:CelD/BcsL family acetyltransferase involved in cellulose biosynthesis